MVDGDKSLVVADEDFIRIAERNMIGIVPLYYNMRKASPVELNNQNIYAGLNAAFTGGNIGIYSNNISKIWNSEIFISGTEEEKKEAIDCVKLLCMENNFVIDYAKTLYKPTRPEWADKKISQFTGSKLPAFFEFAKEKTESQVESRNQSLVNRLYNIIPNRRISTKGLNLEKLDYKKMMRNVNIRCPLEVSALYNELNSTYRYMIHLKDDKADNMPYIACKLRDEFLNLGYSEETLTDMLVYYTYSQNIRYKDLLWFCFGRRIVNNLKCNVEIDSTKFVQCVDCGEWFEISSKNNRTHRCPICQESYRKDYKRNSMKATRMST